MTDETQGHECPICGTEIPWAVRAGGVVVDPSDTPHPFDAMRWLTGPICIPCRHAAEHAAARALAYRARSAGRVTPWDKKDAK